ncbi:MAG: dienelactone hydrolase family protein [Dehalococcoidia bacterium]|nr:dienelactone hydrolase family protein [Dehalococcoidia bacterium]
MNRDWNGRRAGTNAPLCLTAVLLLAGALLQACDGDGSGAPSPTAMVPTAADPSLPGPYPIGVTELTFIRESSTTGEERILKTLAWYPADESAREQLVEPSLGGVIDAEIATDGAPFPVIIFSHGSGGIPQQSTYYTGHLASHGFVVAAPPHPGNTLNDCFPCREQAGLLDSFLNRPDDVRFVLESLLALNGDTESIFYEALDSERVGMSGHSFGGLVTMQLAQEDSPFSAALAMAPPGGSLANLTIDVAVPTLIMGGRLDRATPAEQQEDYFDAIEGVPHFLLLFPQGGHLSFSDVCVPALGGCEEGLSQERAHELINFYATAFFKTYLTGEKGYEDYLTPEAAAGNSDIEFFASVPD